MNEEKRLGEDYVFEPGPNKVFVFGSNQAGIHGAGAAWDALTNYGAKWGSGFGHLGNSFAIPTKNKNLESLPLELIGRYVDFFLLYAGAKPDLEFFVTRIGCGLAGYRDEDIAPLFKDAPSNCLLPPGWREYNSRQG